MSVTDVSPDHWAARAADHADVAAVYAAKAMVSVEITEDCFNKAFVIAGALRNIGNSASLQAAGSADAACEAACEAKCAAYDAASAVGDIAGAVNVAQAARAVVVAQAAVDVAQLATAAVAVAQEASAAAAVAQEASADAAVGEACPWTCTVCGVPMAADVKSCPACEADFSEFWWCTLCSGPVPPNLDECMGCQSMAPLGKVGASEILLKKVGKKVVMTLAGHNAARLGEIEHAKDKMVQSRDSQAD